MGKVFFTKEITGESLVKIFEYLDNKLEGRVAVKISTGELGGHNFLNSNLIKDLVQKLNGTIVECNTAYNGKRFETADHLETARAHGFTDIAEVDIMDSEGEMSLKVEGGKHLKENFVGKNLDNYDSILMLSHFKGHPMGGFGGALKNMSIGIASKEGKVWIHTAGKTKKPSMMFLNFAQQDKFLECMGEACKSVIDYMDGKILYINVMNNLSVDCDCNANPKDPCMKDIGILASTDPVSLDRACTDLIYNSTDPGQKDMVKRIERQNGLHILDYAEELGLGSNEYELIDID